MEQEKKEVEKGQGCGCGGSGSENSSNSCCGRTSGSSKLSCTVKTIIFIVVILAALAVAFIIKK